MNAHVSEFLPHSNGDSSREGVNECTYILVQTEESILVEGTDVHLSCPEQELAVASISMNIGAHICFTPNGFESASMPLQLQSPTTPHNEDPSELSCVLTESTSATTDSIVLKKLLRKSRYFDVGDSCLEDRAAGRRGQRSRKLCYLCGRLQHDAKKCPKRRPCYSCKKKGHYAVDCPMNIEESERICLRCGEIGHELSSCNNDYCPDDLKKIRCYVCNELGHIYCGSCVDNISMTTVSCYNCGESGHSGLQCPKPLVEKCGSQPPSICYKCGEEGHLARNCIITFKASRCSEGGQGGASHLGPGTDDGDKHQNNKKARRSKSFKPRRRKLKGLVDCMTV